MSTKNLKKVLGKIYRNAKEKDVTKRTFDPAKYPRSWPAAIKYVTALDRRMQFNAIFRPAYAAIYQEMREEGCVKNEAKRRAKEKAKEFTKAQLAAKAAAQQGGAGQDQVQPQAT